MLCTGEIHRGRNFIANQVQRQKDVLKNKSLQEFNTKSYFDSLSGAPDVTTETN